MKQYICCGLLRELLLLLLLFQLVGINESRAENHLALHAFHGVESGVFKSALQCPGYGAVLGGVVGFYHVYRLVCAAVERLTGCCLEVVEVVFVAKHIHNRENEVVELLE